MAGWILTHWEQAVFQKAQTLPDLESSEDVTLEDSAEIQGSQSIDYFINLAKKRFSTEFIEWEQWIVDVVLGCIRYRRLIAVAIDSFAGKKKPSGKIRKALEIGCYQVWFHDEAVASKALAETKSWIESFAGVPGGRFSYAFLKSAHKQKPHWLTPPEDKKSQAYAPWLNYPDPWRKELERTYSAEKLLQMRESERTPPIFYTLSKDALSAPIVRKVGADLKPNEISQNPSSQKAVALVHEWIQLKFSGDPRGCRILDLCAAPGGKAIHLSWLGYPVSAYEISSQRRKRLIQNLNRCNLADQIELLRDPPTDKEKSKGVWIDAPCTGSGVVRKHPEIPFVRAQGKTVFGDRLELQKDLLQQGILLVEAGGFLVYSVCSIFPDEGAAQIRAFLKRNSQTTRFAFEQVWLPGEICAGSEGFYIGVVEIK